MKKKILITGKNSFVGQSLEKWLNKSNENYQVETLDMKDSNWIKEDFSSYDVIFHVAGLAHVSTNSKLKELYYKINTELTYETAKKAKREGVKQFIFMSSIIIYGDGESNTTKVINKETIPKPNNFYGESKLNAEKLLIKLSSDDFNIAIVRPPMIYGKGSKGNYTKLSKLAKKISIFPNIKNQRSMIFIENFCEFIKMVIDENKSGVFFPQNLDYVCTSKMFETIRESFGKKTRLIKTFNPIIKLFFSNNKYYKKVFGNLVYDKSLSHFEYNYNVCDLKESIERTESN